MINKWTNEELDFLINNYIDMTDLEISQILKTHPKSSVKNKRQNLGLLKDNHKKKYNFNDVKNEFLKTNYILLSKKSEYINSGKNNLRYICPLHKDKGEQTISLHHLINGRGCYYCGRLSTETAHIKTDEEINSQCFEYCVNSNLKYIGYERINGLIYIKYKCDKHLNLGIQYMRKGNMNRDYVKGCPYCISKNKMSKGECKVKEILDMKNIEYIQQYKFNDCKDTNCLPFDFYLPKFNIVIEFDGQHHYFPVNYNGISNEEAEYNHKKTLLHDEIKNEYCKLNNIKILRIPYYDIDDMENIIDDFILKNRRKTA